MASEMNDKKKVMIVFGGASPEHEISRISAASLLDNIDREKYDILKVGITRAGSWIMTQADPSSISDGSWEEDGENCPVCLSLDLDDRGFFCRGEGQMAKIDIDVIFPVLHGKNGEDGTIQGLLAMAGIPFVGSDTASSASCMDKAMTKAIVEQAEVARQAKCCVIHRNSCDAAEAAEGAEVFFKGNYPLFVKPVSTGSSVGISKVKNREELIEGIDIAFGEDRKILVEEAIFGRELEVAVLGNDDPAVSGVGEIFPAHEFYDYEAKYMDCGSRTEDEADLPAEIRDEIRETALKIYRVMECRGLARVDFFLDEEGGIVFNELNTMPGFTKISMYPKLWAAVGLTYSDLISRLIELACE